MKLFSLICIFKANSKAKGITRNLIPTIGDITDFIVRGPLLHSLFRILDNYTKELIEELSSNYSYLSVHFDVSDVIGYHVNKAGISPPTIIETTNKTADLYIVVMNIPKDPTVFTWSTRTICVFGNEDDVQQFAVSLNRALRGTFKIYSLWYIFVYVSKDVNLKFEFQHLMNKQTYDWSTRRQLHSISKKDGLQSIFICLVIKSPSKLFIFLVYTISFSDEQRLNFFPLNPDIGKRVLGC